MGYKVTRIMALILFLIMITATIPLGYAIEWSPDMRLTWNSEIDANPSIAQANDGKIWVVWHSYRTGNADLFYKVYDSSKVHPWSSEKNLTANPNADISPAIMQAQDGKIWVVWSTNRTGNYEIYYKTSSDNGATWSWPEKNLTANPKDDECPSIMQVANGTIWLAWSANRTGNFDVYYKTSQDNGATWSTDKFLNIPTTNDRNPSITQAANGKIWFVWERDKDQKLHIWYTTYDYDYTYNKWMWWGSIYPVTTAPNTSNYNPSVMSAIDGKIWIAWDSSIGEAGQADIYYQTRSPPEFNAIVERIQLTINSGEDFAPSIMQAADETIWITWAAWRTSPPNCDIYYKTTKIPQPNDVAIFSVNCTEVTVNAGEKVFIEIVAQNHGTNSTNVLVKLYADLTKKNESLFGLSPGQLHPLILTWTASNTGTYKIWAKANIVYGEIYTVDNTFPALLGDVNDDRTVNASDVSVFSNAYGSKPGDSKWNPNCNFDGFNGDNKVDAFDLFDLGKNYGRSQ